MCLRTKLELTFAILKPHVAAVPFRLQDIHSKILANGFYIVRTKKQRITLDQAKEFYDEHREKFFYNRLVTFMSSGPCYFHILARENAIQFWRNLMGPTKVFKTIFTHPHTIRGVHGLSDTRNATHGSDSEDSFKKEAKVFFPDFSASEWYSKEEDKFVRGETQFDSENFIHVIKCNDR
ncbi:hypothetical protein RUM44_009104 [Polyplax serrata]|uniref:Nucleoside diphosphate kinase n=1 Tax=Polyplax serrata TaxID=468196 RepID=A0ABR1ARZ2_POLSC